MALDARRFIRHVRSVGISRYRDDDEWLARYAASCLVGDAFQFHASLREEERASWAAMERAFLAKYPAGRSGGRSFGARVHLALSIITFIFA